VVSGLRERVSLAAFTTLEVGGEARFFLEARDRATVVAALAWASVRGLPVVVLGGGSNLLIADRGVDALVLQIRIGGVEVGDEGGRVIVRAGAGEPWDGLCERAVRAGWAGIECLSGIPGAVGATPIQNVGAYGQEVAETIVEVCALDRGSGHEVLLDRAACGFGYRDSVFKREAQGRYVVVEVTFALRGGGPPTVRYPELRRVIDSRMSSASGQAEPTLAEVRAAVLDLRRGKSMVLDSGDENRRSAGSFFTNPIVTVDHLERVRARVAEAGALAPGEAMPEFPASLGRVKLSAAWLIERAGFVRGTADGAVGISTRHTLAIVNRGGATAAGVLAFARRVRDRVEERFGVALTPEPVLLGFTAEEVEGLQG
jgi:UDP-N-acetylmuramate dehydrogenase